MLEDFDKALTDRVSSVQFFGPQLDAGFHKFFGELLEYLREKVNSLGPPKATKEAMRAYIQLNHECWKVAQWMIAARLLELFEIRMRLLTEIKEFHCQKKYEEKKEKEDEALLVEIETLILRRSVDHIAWMTLGADPSSVRRLSLKGGEHNFSAKNILDAMPTVDELNKDPNKMAVACDMTTFIHIGDIYCVDQKTGKKEFIELKSGEKNHHFTKVATQTHGKENERNSFEKSLNQKDKKHFRRASRQVDRAFNVRENLNHGRGLDNLTQRLFKSSIAVEKPTSFAFEIGDCYQQVSSGRKFAIKHIDNCLYLGLYPDVGAGIATFSAWLFAMGCKDPIVNITDSMRIPHARPFTCLDLSGEVLLKILEGKLILLMALDVRGLVEQANVKFGQILALEKPGSIHDPDTLLQTDGKAVTMTKGVEKVYLGNGISDRIFFDLQHPLNAIGTLVTSIPG